MWSGGLSEGCERSPVPWQQVGEALGRVVGDSGEHVAQVGFRIKLAELRALDHAVERRSALGSTVRAGEQVVLAPNRNTSESPLGRIVVQRQ